MPKSFTRFQLTLFFFVIIIVLVVLSITFQKSEPRTDPGVSIASLSAPDLALPPVDDSDRAFVTIQSSATSVARGDTATFRVYSNEWSQCMTDVYTPNEGAQVFKNPADAQAKLVSPGQFVWQWHVPTDATFGTWTLRFICGTYINMATADLSVGVR